MARANGVGWSSIGMVVGALLAAPCFVGIMLIPIGLGAVATGGLFMFLDEYRLVSMAVAVALVGVSHWGLQHARDFRPTKLVWALTVLTVLLIAGELIVDPL